MIFSSGTHVAVGAPIAMNGVTNFQMIGVGDFTKSEYTTQLGNITLWESSSIIRCQGNRTGINFTSVADILIKNITFTGCSSINSLYRGPLVFDTGKNLMLDGVTLRNNVGYGLHTFQLQGNVTIRNCTFRSNTASREIEGGNCNFFYTECDTALDTHINISYSNFLDGSAFYYPGVYPTATGITIKAECPGVQVDISHVKLANNHGEIGGNMAITLTPGVRINIRDSQIINGTAYRGGGLKIKLTTSRQSNASQPLAIYVENVDFAYNGANISGGALYITAYQQDTVGVVTTVHIRNCKFFGNRIQVNGSGAAAEIFKHSQPGYIEHSSPQFMTFDSCSFTSNYPQVIGNNQENDQAATVDVNSVEKIVFRNCNFTDNKATALFLVSSSACFEEKNSFKRNQAVNGGAIKFCQTSAMYIRNDTHIEFIGNSAQVAGGAIFSETRCSAYDSPCFFQPRPFESNDTVADLLDYSNNFYFANNTARYAGDAIYGGAIDDCFTYLPLCTEDKKICSTYISDRFYNNVFRFEPRAENKRGFDVSSNPVDVCFCFNDSFNCNVRSYTYPYPIYPGEELNVSAVVVGQRNGVRPGTIRSSIRYGTHTLNEKQSDMRNRECQNIALVVGNMPQVVVSFEAEKSDPTTDAFFQHKQPPQIIANLLPCPWGFKLSQNENPAEHTMSHCECDQLLRGQQCQINSHSVLRISPTWIGKYYRHGENCTEATDDSRCYGVIFKLQCPFDYCSKSSVSLNITNLDDQCADNREGVLCGKCKKGYSRVTGSMKCKKCSDRFFLYVLLFLIAGVFLVAVLVVFNLTVTTGTLNGLIFYANFIRFNPSMYFPADEASGVYHMTKNFIFLLNMDMGIKTCIYDSTDAYTENWLEFTFPVYIWIIAFLIIRLSRRYRIVMHLVGKNAVKMLATLIFLSYARLLRAIIDTFQSTIITQGDKKIVVWLHDANVTFYSIKRIPILAVAAAFGVASVAYALILTFLPWLNRCPNRSVLCLLQKWKPFFDAYTGPYKDQYRFWPGMLFLIRILLFTGFALNVLGDPSLNLFLITIACLFTFLLAWFLGGVYRNVWMDRLEAFFIFNLGATSVSTMFVATKIDGKSWVQQTVIYTSILASMVVFTGILCYHCYQRLKDCRSLQQVGEWCWRKQLDPEASTEEIQNLVQNQEVQRPAVHSLTPSLSLPQPMPLVVTFDRYREDILECEDD